MSPLPTTRVIPAGWSQHHYPTVRGTLTGKCRVMRPGTGSGVFDPETGDTIPPEPTVVYDGPCRVQEIQREAQRVVAGGQGLSRETHRVVLTEDAPAIQAGENRDWVQVYEAPDDFLLATGSGRFYIEHVQVGTVRWERDLICWFDTSRQVPEES